MIVKLNSPQQHFELKAALDAMGLDIVIGKTTAHIPNDTVPQVRAEIEARIEALRGTGKRGRLNALNSVRRHLGGALRR